jgi:hypothetical protein
VELLTERLCGMKLNKEELIEKARGSATFGELAQRMGVLDGVEEEDEDGAVDVFMETALDLCPDIQLLMERCEVEREMHQCADVGDQQGRREAAARLQDLTIAVIDADLDMPLQLAHPTKTLSGKGKVQGTPATVPAKTKIASNDASTDTESGISAPKQRRSRVAKSHGGNPLLLLDGRKRKDLTDEDIALLRTQLNAVAPEEISCIPLRGDVLGAVKEVIPGTDIKPTYQGRQVVVLLMRAGVFGKEVVEGRTVRRVTLHKGILNHSDMEEYPSPYWIVTDEMSELGKFSKGELIKSASKRYAEKRDKRNRVGGYPSVKKFEAAMSWAYDVLKTHHMHPRKCYAGMSHFVEDCGVGPDKGRSIIRGRKSHETLEFFRTHRQQLDGARKDGRPMASLENRSV